MVELADKNFKTAAVNMFKELKKNMNMRSEQIENFNKEMEWDVYFWNEKEYLQKNFIDGFNSRLNITEEKIHESEYAVIKTTQTKAEGDKKKRWKKRAKTP